MTVNFKNLKITTTYQGNKCWDCLDGFNENWNNHIVTIKNNDNGKWTRFDFWCSIAHPNFETEYDVLNAFRCFIDDCIAGEMTLQDFCYEFGYDYDSIKAKKIWKACQRSSKKFHRIFDDDLYDVLDSLEEYA